MPRIDVPEDFEAGAISVAGAKDYHHGQADVNLEDVDHARDLSVREDDDGRYVGPSGDYADAIREFLGVDGDDEADGCPHCDDYDGDHLAQHIGQAHPEVDD